MNEQRQTLEAIYDMIFVSPVSDIPAIITVEDFYEYTSVLIYYLNSKLTHRVAINRFENTIKFSSIWQEELGIYKHYEWQPIHDEEFTKNFLERARDVHFLQRV